MRFRAHETFAIRKGWLHKGMKYIINYPKVFTDKALNPLETFGMGSNMVKALRYWLVASGLTYEDTKLRQQALTVFGKLVWENDKYLEEDGTLYLIHYFLSSNFNFVTSWYYFFNVYNSNEITKENYLESINIFLLGLKKENDKIKFSERALVEDFECILKTYLPNKNQVSPESNMESPFSELGILNTVEEQDKTYKKEIPRDFVISPLILLAVIIREKEKKEERSKEEGKEEVKITEMKIDELENAPCNIGKVFNLDTLSIAAYLDRLQNMGFIKVVRTAGLDIIKFVQDITFNKIIEEYYSSLD